MKTILDLPQDLLLLIISELTFKDVISLCQTNKKLHLFSMASNPRQKLLWKILIQNTFSGVYDYQNKLKILSDKICSNIQDIEMNEDGYCYNYLIYTSFVKNLDKATQMMIYYKQCNMKSFNTGSLVDRYVSMFLLKKPSQMDKIFDQMKKEQQNEEFHQEYKKLLKAQNPNPTQNTLDQLLAVLSKSGYTMAFKILLDKGANIHAHNDRVLGIASRNGHTEIVKMLLEREANVHAMSDDALRHASMKGHKEIVELLLEKGADIHVYHGMPLTLASRNGHTETVKILLDKGACIHSRNDAALREAATYGHTETTKLLLFYGANIHAIKDLTVNIQIIL